MPSRAKDWFGQAERDLDHARDACELGHHEWACFAAQQAAEKAVKAVFQHVGAEACGHSIKTLLEHVPEQFELTADLIQYGRELDRFYIPTRYPNGFDEGKPADYFTQKDSEQAIRAAESIVGFCRDCLSR